MEQHSYAEDFERIFNYTRRICNVIGIDVIKKNYKFNMRTVCLFFVINCGICITFYTCYTETVVQGNSYYLFKTGSVMGTAIQGYSKAVCGLTKRKGLCFMYSEIKDIYEAYESKGLNYRKALQNNIQLVKKVLYTTFGIVTVTVVVVAVVPVLLMLIFQTRLEILPYKIPFINNETDQGFYVTTFTHIMVTILACYGNFVCDSWLFIFVAHVPLIKNILQTKFDELDELLETQSADATTLTNSLNDIFTWHQKYGKFCDSIKDVFFWVIFMQISSEFFGIACTIVCMFLGIWPPAPAFAIYLYSLIFSYCALGNLVESANEDIIHMIYACCWYKLPVPKQKMLLIMLRKSQAASGISIGGMAPLSLSTALHLTKTIYTFSMMLKQSLH